MTKMSIKFIGRICAGCIISTLPTESPAPTWLAFQTVVVVVVSLSERLRILSLMAAFLGFGLGWPNTHRPFGAFTQHFRIKTDFHVISTFPLTWASSFWRTSILLKRKKFMRDVSSYFFLFLPSNKLHRKHFRAR